MFQSRKDILAYCEEKHIDPEYHRYIYVLLLEDSCYYVGMTNHFKRRMTKHFLGKKAGSIWTGLHKPIKIVRVIDADGTTESECAKLESAMTLFTMGKAKNGIQKVRGGMFLVADSLNIQQQLREQGFVKMNKRFVPTKNPKAQELIQNIKRLHKMRIIV